MALPVVLMVLVMVVLIGAVLPAASWAERQIAAQVMRVDIRGAVAHVTVTRTLSCAPSAHGATAARDAITDLALPDRATLVDVEVGGLVARPGASGEVVSGRRFDPTKPAAPAGARDAYLASLRAMDITAAEVAFDDDVRFRARVACKSRNKSNIIALRYSFSVLLEMNRDRLQLVFPAAPEPSPPATRVEVRVEPAGSATEISIAGASYPQRAGTPTSASGIVSGRARWSLSLDLGPTRTAPRDPARLTALASMARPHATTLANEAPIAYAVGLPSTARDSLPERVLFLVDRSRSVGPGGLEAERDIARRILEALPPATRFDAVFFDRGQKRLFPVARTATRQAIAAFEEEMVPARLANGTELGAALLTARDLLRREATEFGPRALLIILSDGAVGISLAGGQNHIDPLPPLPGVEVMTAAISVRPNDDPAVSPDERRVLRALAAAAPLGGVERAIHTGEIGDAVPAILEALRTGGDVYGVQLLAKDRTVAVADMLAPGSGASGIASVSPPATLAYRTHGQNRQLTLRPVAIDARWLLPFGTRDSSATRVLVGPGVAALVEPVVHAPGPAATTSDLPRGMMERSVVRDALSLAFTPRARACYLNRSARTPADRDLSGRVRLALDLVRGEVGAARVESSTLAHPLIETCLRDAAYALDVPRAYRNDDPVTAILNLVFRPRTPERRGGIENAGLDKEIDLLVEAALKEPVLTPVAPVAIPDAGTAPER